MTLNDLWEKVLTHLSSFWKRTKEIPSGIFSDPQEGIKSQQELAPFPVEEIAFPKWDPPQGIFDDLVIDFGTTATVVGTVRAGHQDVDSRSLDLLAGASEFASEMSISPDGEVSAVGPSALSDQRSKPNHLLVTSMKRYLELASRDGSSASFQKIVEDFLEKGVGDRYRLRKCLGSTSQIVISVPNSFNPRAVEGLRRGAVNAINDLNGNDSELLVDSHNVKLVRESEAVAYLYCRKDLLGKAPTMEAQMPKAAFEWDCLHPADLKQEGGPKMIVLDVGGGTTDLSVVEVDPSASDEGAVRILLNAGVALGGTDVDNLLLRSLLSLEINPTNISSEWPIDQRVRLLEQIRSYKDSDADQIFSPPEEAEPDEFRKTLHLWMTQIPIAVQRFSPGTDECGEEDTRIYRKEANDRLRKLVRLSVTGLFDLIPDNLKDNVSRILLTGRAARLRGIREAVIEKAQKLGASVEYPRYPYHAKLVVAYGCALVNSGEFRGSRLPTGTLGRKLQVVYRGNQVFASFEADFPASADAPTLFQARIPSQTDHERQYFPREAKTEVTPEFSSEMNDGPGNADDYLDWLGCGRFIAKWDTKPRQPATIKHLLWQPANEIYYTVEKEQWKARRPPKPLCWSDLNYVTALPLGFPYEEMEGKLGSERGA